MNIKFPDCCIALRQAFEVDMVSILPTEYSDKNAIYWFNNKSELIKTKTCPFCGKSENPETAIQYTE